MAGIATKVAPAASPPPITTMNTPKIETLRPPGTLEPTAQWIIDQQKERITELKDELKKQTDKLEKVRDEKESLKGELEDAIKAADAKPGALAGFLSNPELMNKGLEILQGFLNRPALDGVTNPLTDWFTKQPEPVQIQFITLIQQLNKAPEKISENLTSINRQLMSVSSGGGNNRPGVGFGR